MPDENGVPTLEEQKSPDYVAPLDLGAQQHNYDHPAAHTDASGALVREEANPLPGPDSVTGPDKENKEFTETGALDPRELVKGEGGAKYDGDAPKRGAKATGEPDNSSPEHKSKYSDKH